MEIESGSANAAIDSTATPSDSTSASSHTALETSNLDDSVNDGDEKEHEAMREEPPATGFSGKFSQKITNIQKNMEKTGEKVRDTHAWHVSILRRLFACSVQFFGMFHTINMVITAGKYIKETDKQYVQYYTDLPQAQFEERASHFIVDVADDH